MMYRPLNASDREIRIVEILPPNPIERNHGNRSTIAVCLRYCSLNAPIPFEALSYTWGAPDDLRYIRVDETDEVPVRSNLEKALKDLRLLDSSRLIWIDALSINQADLLERREQVQLMREIYASASIVRTWIDLDLDHSSDAISQLHTLSDNDAAIRDLGEAPGFWAPIGKILANEYWSRVWIQQEIAYATQWAIQCRTSTISGRGLIKFTTLLVLKEWGFFTNPLEDKAGWKALMPEPLRPLLYRSRKDDGRVLSSTFYGPLHRALRDCRHLRATDPRDKIFAMLGMIDDYQESDIDVRYDLAVEQIYKNVVKLCVEKFHSLDFLREATLGNRAVIHKNWPTWLPDWSVESMMKLLTSPSFSLNDLYPESKGLQTSPASFSDLLLHGSGCLIASVSSILAEAQEEDLWSGKLNVPLLVAKLQYFKKLIDDIDIPVPDEATDLDDYSSEYLLRALTGADGRDTESRRFSSYSNIFRHLLQASSPSEHVEKSVITASISTMIEENQDHFGDIVHYMRESCRGRKLFLTEYLGMGLVPVQAETGDEIWYILGCPTPMCLRKDQDHYTVVGEAYLNECMRWRIFEGELQTSEGLALTNYAVQSLTLH